MWVSHHESHCEIKEGPPNVVAKMKCLNFMDFIVLFLAYNYNLLKSLTYTGLKFRSNVLKILKSCQPTAMVEYTDLYLIQYKSVGTRSNRINQTAETTLIFNKIY